MDARRGIAEGMTVYTQDGEKLGKVIAVDDAGQLGTAANPPEGSTANTGLQWGMEPLGTTRGTSGRRSDSIQEGADSARIDELERTGIASGRVPVDESGRGVAPSRLESDVRSGLAPGRTADVGRDLGDTDRDLTIPLAEEQLEARKTEREAGELKIHRRVLTEQKTVTVPVRRETADVERVSVSDRPVGGDEGLFREETVSVPLREEEIEVTKRPVIRGEVRVAKGNVEEQRQVSDTVRREEVDVEPEGDVRRSDRRDPDDHHVP